ncbi:ribosomal RNA processing protein 36 [Plakobranchus ocellatus]|uniref:rRNA biogenesis protein RRP36 n=1 Tax=Plakobranchus ocellatus TaxID=259542 RepID=A0AAV3Z5C3_9GAST|nr:ribosomal RNA processing protein 36 [Plakobranchus ocellatus]
MSHVPLSELKAMQERLGLKEFNKLRNGFSSTKAPTTSFKRENKNRPSELSARRPVPRNTPVAKTKINRDPRFDDLSGEYNEKIFKSSYGFLSDVKLKEKQKLKKVITKTKSKDKKVHLKQLYNRMEQQEAAEKKKAKAEAMEKEWKKKELERVKEGKRPFFMKKSQKKALIAEELRKEAEQSGALHKTLAKKQKKLAANEKKKKAWSTKDV